MIEYLRFPSLAFGLSFSLALASALGPLTTASAADRDAVSTGKTQVVARIAGREVTLSELRLEMAELGLSPEDPAAERVALENLTNRLVLARAARAADFHRKPQAMARMYAAQDKALADLYLATASRPPEPTRDEIDGFIQANPTLFGKREVYDFFVLSLDSEHFDETVLTPYFDEDADFDRLTALLDKAGAPYDLAVSTRMSNQFPAPIREQLARYGAKDNIVLNGSEQTQILKIISKRPAPMARDQFGLFARQLLLREQAEERAQRFLDNIKKEAGIQYYRASAAPIPAAGDTANEG